MKFWKQIKSLFITEKSSIAHNDCNPQPTDPKGEILYHELINRNQNEIAYYGYWKGSEEKQEMLDWITQQYDAFCSKSCGDKAICFLMIPSVNGFVIKYDEKRWKAEDFVCLFDYFKEKLNEIGYWAHVSDVKASQQSDYVESSQRHYLKPPRNFDLEEGQTIDQYFGNIMITLCQVDDQLMNLKFSATHYNDRMYKGPKDFKELIQHICTD